MKKFLRKTYIYGAGIFCLLLLTGSVVSVSAQPSEPSVLCQNGSRIPIRVLTATSCELSGSVTVSDAIRDLCMNIEPIAARRNCISNAGGGPTTAPTTARVGAEPECTSGLSRGCPIFEYILLATNLLSAAVGVIVVIMIVVGGIQYISARDNPQAVAAARDRIFNAILALVIFMVIAAFLQWVVPGGVLSPPPPGATP